MTQKKYREALLANADGARQSRELARIRTDVAGRRSRSSASATAGPTARALLRALLASSASARCSTEFAPTADTVGKDYALVDTRRPWARSRRSLRAPAASRCARSRRPAPVRAAIVGLAFATRRGRRATCRSAHRALDAGRRSIAARGARGAEAGCWRTPRRARSGHDLKLDAILLGARRHHAARARARHDARQLPARRDAVGARARGERARAPRLQGARPKRTSAGGREGARLRRPAAGRAARLRRRAGRPRAAAGATSRAAARAARGSTASTATSNCRSSRCWRTSSGPA